MNGEFYPQIFDFQNWIFTFITLLFHYFFAPPFTLGSRKSRRPSPRRFRLSTQTTTAIPGQIMVHGAFENTSLLSCSIFPQLAAGAGIPAPKKLKDASEMIACAKMKEALQLRAGKFKTPYNQAYLVTLGETLFPGITVIANHRSQSRQIIKCRKAQYCNRLRLRNRITRTHQTKMGISGRRI